MARLLLVHWNAREAGERAEWLRGAGHEVRVHSRGGSPVLRECVERPVDAVVIDLGRLPSHGAAVGTWLRQRKATRNVPLLFAGGAEEKVADARNVLPDAVFTPWSRIRSAVRKSLAKQPVNPVVPGTMQSYSGTPLVKKLGIKAGQRVLLLGAPAGFERELEPLPSGTAVRRQAHGTAPLILLFVKSQRELERRWSKAVGCLADPGRLWVVWPKKASGIATDVTGNTVRRHGLGQGLVDFKICAVNDTWSGLAFTRRRE